VLKSAAWLGGELWDGRREREEVMEEKEGWRESEK
jgi:hypothetical protein